jgi:hypothetical protein
MPLNSAPDLEQSLDNYFRERLNEISREFDPPTQEDTLWYLANMLSRFGNSDQVFSQQDGVTTLRPLALLYKDAHEAGSTRERCLILRHLGDLSLFLGAILPEAFARRGIGKDYFVGMGGGAYDYLSENAHGNRHVFSELASKFTRMIQLVAKACCRQTFFDSRDILNLYQRWLTSQDPLMAQQLQAVGIEPVSTRKH